MADHLHHRSFLAGASVLLVGATALLSGCSSLNEGGASGGGSAAPDDVTVGVVLSQTLVSRWKFDQQGIEDQLKKLGAKSIVVSAESDDQKQRSAIENMVTQGVDALIIAPVNADTAASSFAIASDAGIPVIDYNFIAPDAEFDYAITRSARDYGKQTAESALEAHPTGNYIIIGGDPASSVAQDTTAGYLDALQPAVDAGDITIVSQQYNAGWSPQTAQQQVEEALVAAKDDVSAILSNNDGMATGAITALQAQKLKGVFVSGVDADLLNVQAIVQGTQTLSIWTDYSLMGTYAADAAYAAATGTDLDVPNVQSVKYTNGEKPTVVMETINVTQDTVCDWINQYGYYTAEEVYGDQAATECPAS
ncbi:MAG: D-xylose transporter substrate-binding protein [Naasia sp.]|jgi:D-xylose transport system substrate-binding protein|uniref:substrate-binding domain-containing protein n=1 Tax=Naasia sp. TaxID=2546198 RepID=UPI0026223B00|nr:substrate-binding domain-containing protein [Naasia sp.]MCU1570826.1 D-xylose transporter substrate-binding protein [Naasia sp.]